MLKVKVKNKERTVEETVLNIFVLIEDELVVGIRAAAHKASGTDDEKEAFLNSLEEEDFENGEDFDLPEELEEGIPFAEWLKFEEEGLHVEMFEDIGLFDHFDAPDEPLMVVTHSILDMDDDEEEEDEIKS